MSMILEALSRAEKERQADNASHLDTSKYVTSSNIREDRFKKWVLIALLANFILIVLVSIGFAWKSYFPSTSSTDDIVLQKEPITTEVIVSPEKVEPEPEQIFPDAIASSTESDLNVSSLSEEARVAKAAIKKNAVKKQISKVAKQTPPVKYSNKPLSPPQNHISNVAGNTTGQAKPQPSQIDNSNYPKLLDLPVAQRANLGEYEMNVHVYDDNPQSRFVLIDMVRYKEGDRLPGGRGQISSIVPEGVILDYAGNKILLERNQ